MQKYLYLVWKHPPNTLAGNSQKPTSKRRSSLIIEFYDTYINYYKYISFL